MKRLVSYHQSVEKSNAATRSCNLFAWQIIFLSLDHCACLDGAITFVCKDLLTGKRVTYFQSLSSKYGNYLESKRRELKKDLWANRSDEYKLKWSEDRKKWWDKRSDDYKLEWSEDKQKWWDDQSDEYKL